MFPIVTIIGIGLMGGSLGLSLKKRNLSNYILGVDTCKGVLDTALEIGAIDKGFLNLTESVKDSDLIIICTPSNEVLKVLNSIEGYCKESVVITDISSTKSLICNTPTPLSDNFIGSHPMIGSEKSGNEFSSSDLYENVITFVESLKGQDKKRYDKLISLWEGLGSKVISIDPETHDQWMAKTSHIPHIVSSGLVQLIHNPTESLPFIGRGFKDTTRLASGSPRIWKDICLTNPKLISQGLRELSDILLALSLSIDNANSEEILNYFESSLKTRNFITSN